VKKKIKVLIVDDSAVVRMMLKKALSADPEIEVSGLARDPFIARDIILKDPPDVLTLDMEMPRMDGMEFLKILMEQKPIPVIVLSTLTQRGSQLAMDAIQMGAVDVVGKPSSVLSFENLVPQLIQKIKGAARAGIQRSPIGKRVAQVLPPRTGAPQSYHPQSLILIGASTGGTQAIKHVLEELPVDLPPIAIVQHIPPSFSKAFADRLNQVCAIAVKEAEEGDVPGVGQAVVAPGNFHMVMNFSANHYRVSLNQGPQVWHQRPAVDILFRSVVKNASQVLAVLLTGMGKDGAEGLLELKNHGARTFAQDEASSVVYGMPKAAVDLGAAQEVLPLSRVSTAITRHFHRVGH